MRNINAYYYLLTDMSRATTSTTSYCYSDPTELENRSSSRYLVIDETGFSWGLGDSTHRRRNLPNTTVSTTTTTVSITIGLVATTPASGGHN